MRSKKKQFVNKTIKTMNSILHFPKKKAEYFAFIAKYLFHPNLYYVMCLIHEFFYHVETET